MCACVLDADVQSDLCKSHISCYHINSKSCCIAILHVNSLLIAIHSPLCTSASAHTKESFDRRGRGWAWWYGNSELGSSDPLHSLCFFVWKAHCLCCAHLGKYFTKRPSWTQKETSFVPSLPFILFALLCTEEKPFTFIYHISNFVF